MSILLLRIKERMSWLFINSLLKIHKRYLLQLEIGSRGLDWLIMNRLLLAMVMMI